jgi:hypothetical protein
MLRFVDASALGERERRFGVSIVRATFTPATEQRARVAWRGISPIRRSSPDGRGHLLGLPVATRLEQNGS